MAGDIEVPIEFKVENLRDGKSFNTRRVTAFPKGEGDFCPKRFIRIDEKGLSQCKKSPASFDLKRNLIPDKQTFKRKPK